MDIPAKRECTKCHLEKDLATEFKNNRKKGKYGKQSICKKCMNAKAVERRKTKTGRAKVNAYRKTRYRDSEYREKLQAQRSTPQGMLWLYKSNAKRRDLQFDLSIEDIKEHFWEKDCRYCGTSGTSGIDRVDNSMGYVLSNAVPCCTTCNLMKAQMCVQDFVDHCRKVASFSPGPASP